MTTQPAFYPLLTAHKTDLLNAFLHAAYQLQLPIAFWQLPNEKEQHVIVDLGGKTSWIKADLEDFPAGFVFAPFKNGEHQCHFLRADLHYSTDADILHEHVETIAFDSEIAQTKKQFLEQVEHFLTGNNASKILPYFLGNESTIMSDENHFLEIVEKAVSEMEKGGMQKVVLSRNKEIVLPIGFQVVGNFIQLCETYPTAFVSLVSLPEIGTWTGASPEILIEVKQQRYFRTVALAGTQPRGEYVRLADAMWRQKEIEEQALVSRYIINNLKKIRLREFEEIGPKTVQAGLLIHLRTEFLIDMEEVNFPLLGSVMLELLHPTSAVCGMPKAPAVDFIDQHEGYDRDFYSGFLGPVQMGNDTHIFVNLRCARLLQGKAILFAGAGITSDSDPDREFRETEMKMDIMRRVLTGE